MEMQLNDGRNSDLIFISVPVGYMFFFVFIARQYANAYKSEILCEKLCEFRPKLSFISEAVRDRPIVTMDH